MDTSLQLSMCHACFHLDFFRSALHGCTNLMFSAALLSQDLVHASPVTFLVLYNPCFCVSLERTRCVEDAFFSSRSAVARVLAVLFCSIRLFIPLVFFDFVLSQGFLFCTGLNTISTYYVTCCDAAASALVVTSRAHGCGNL